MLFTLHVLQLFYKSVGDLTSTLTLPRIGRVSKAEIYSIKSGKGSLWQRFKKSIHESSKRKRYGWPRPVGSRSRKLPASWALATPLSINGARNWQSMAKKRFQAVDTKRC